MSESTQPDRVDAEVTDLHRAFAAKLDEVLTDDSGSFPHAAQLLANFARDHAAREVEKATRESRNAEIDATHALMDRRSADQETVADLRAQLVELNTILGQRGHDVIGAAKEAMADIVELREKLAAARKDGERLDALLGGLAVKVMDGGFLRTSMLHYRFDRIAIDAAISATKEGGKL